MVRVRAEGVISFIRTNTGAIQVTYWGEVARYAPLRESTERSIWLVTGLWKSIAFTARWNRKIPNWPANTACSRRRRGIDSAAADA